MHSLDNYSLFVGSSDHYYSNFALFRQKCELRLFIGGLVEIER